MSGHSKWAQIHRQKSAADAKKGALFTKLGNAITLAAKTGGGNPETNFKLKLAIDQAKAANMPKDNIERAIKRGTGEIAGGPIEELRYEGFGPGGVALIIDCLTDNRNRTLGEIKHLLSKHGGNLAGPNSVAWQFKNNGVIRITKQSDRDKEEMELDVIESGAKDFEWEDDFLVIYTEPQDLKSVEQNLEKAGYKIDYAENEMIPKEKIKVENHETLEKLYAALDENPDVNNYYTNAEI